jgi:hypothetical protein
LDPYGTREWIKRLLASDTSLGTKASTVREEVHASGALWLVAGGEGMYRRRNLKVMFIIDGIRYV